MSQTIRRPVALYALNPENLNVIYSPQEQQRIAELAHICAPVQSAATLRSDPSVLKDVEVIFCGWGAPLMDTEFLAAAPKLKAVFYGAGSIRSFTTPEFWERDIVICAAGAANAVPVAEFCLGVTLLSLKDFWGLAAATRRNEGWMRAGTHLRDVPGVFRSTVGFISLGAIAKKTLEFLEDHEVRRLAYSRSLTPEAADRLRVTPASIDEIFAQSDVISLHTPDLPSTKGMIRGRHFELMKPGATFLNTARGAVVNEPEMIEVLARRPDITAVLDVTDPEPPAVDSPLTKLPNVVLTPHLAGSVGKECHRLGAFMVEEFERYLAGEPLLHRIMRADAEAMA